MKGTSEEPDIIIASSERGARPRNAKIMDRPNTFHNTNLRPSKTIRRIHPRKSAQSTKSAFPTFPFPYFRLLTANCYRLKAKNKGSSSPHFRKLIANSYHQPAHKKTHPNTIPQSPYLCTLNLTDHNRSTCTKNLKASTFQL